MPAQTIAFITPSYERDLERCRLLCESMDDMAQGNWQHYILVADHDAPLFKPLTGPRRHIIPDSVLLPAWLKPVRRPFDKHRRWMWVSRSINHMVWPMSGWHVQQLRKMLIARHIDEASLVMTDSDSVFMRPFGNDVFFHDSALRLYAKVDGITKLPGLEKHVQWVAQAQKILGLPPVILPAPDYISNLVSWRREHALAMLEHIEAVNGRELVAAMGRSRTFSEYQIYGAFAEQRLHGRGHFLDKRSLTLTYWTGDMLTEQTLEDFIDTLSDRQIAIGIQSFIGLPAEMLRRSYRARAARLR
ncbi:MAG: DUF6492 family protein [Beijerinckiaceae bacterium]